MVEHNIQIRKKNEANEWENLNPISRSENIIHGNETVNQALENLKLNRVSEKETLVYMFDFSLRYSSKAALVVAGGKNILVDTGDRNHVNEAMTKMRNIGVTHLDVVIVSHYHADHYGGLDALVSSSLMDSTTDVFLPPTPDWEHMKTVGTKGNSDATRWQSAETDTFNLLSGAGISYSFPSEKTWIALSDDASLRFHNTRQTFFSAYYNDLTNDNVQYFGIDYNNFSLVTEIRNGKKHFVFTGDLGLQAQKQLRGTFENSIYFYDVEHHGLNYSYDAEFYKQLNPKYVGIQNADDAYNYYSRGSYGYFKSLGLPIYITGINGDLMFYDSVEGMNITTSRNNGSAETGQLHTYSLTGGYTVLENGTHLDDVTDAGIYIARTLSDVSGISGLPYNQDESVTSSFKLVVETYHDRTRMRQTLYENSGRGYIWYRVYSTNNKWNPWFRLMRTADLSPEEMSDGTGIYLDQGVDLNDITTLGKYSAPTNIVAQSIINKPAEINVAFTVEVYPLHATTRFVQIIRVLNPDADEYTRVHGTSGFQPWNKVQKVRVD